MVSLSQEKGTLFRGDRPQSTLSDDGIFITSILPWLAGKFKW